MNLPFSLNPVLENLPVYQPGRPIEEVARELGLPERGIIKMASNENPLGPSPLALAALKGATRKLHLYPDGNAFYLKQKLAAKLGVGTANLILGNGSNDVLELIAHALLAPGAEAVMSQYCFLVYPLVTRLLGASPVIVPARDYGHDLAAMRRAVTPRTKMIFAANPNNPTGTLAAPAEVRQLLDSTPPEVVIVMDLAYAEYLEAPQDLVPLVRSGEKPNLILLRTFSKIYGLAGLRLGYGIGHPDFVAALEKVRQPFNVNSMAQAAGLAALDDEAHVQKTRQNNSDGLKMFEAALREMGVEYVPSSANFVLLRVGEGSRVAREMQALGVIIRPVDNYGLPEWVRISIGTPRENRRCLKALKKILRKRVIPPSAASP
jgi:histidinol-phosphate aminotransferase